MRALLLLCLLFTSSLLFAQNRFWIATSAGNWNDPNNWSTTANGAGGASVPSTGNAVFFSGVGGRNGQCNLNVAPTVAGVTINGYTGTIDLQGFTLTTTGANTFSTGTISNSIVGAALLQINATANTTFGGTIFNVPVAGSATGYLLNGSTFNSTVDLTKTDNTTNNGTGGNTFAADVSFTITGTGVLQSAATNPDNFQGNITVNLNGTGGVALARVAAASSFNGNIVINYNSPGSFSTGANGGTSTLAVNRTITVGAIGGAGAGSLALGRLTQTGGTAQNFTLSGNQSATLTLGPLSSFSGPIVASAPVLVLNSSTFSTTASFTHTSTNTDGNSRGGNVFNGDVTFTNTGNSDIQLGSNGADPGDTYFGAATFNDLGGGRIRVSAYTTGNVFHGNALFVSNGATDANNRIQVSRFTGSSTTFNGSATFRNIGNSSDIHISFDPGTQTTFNGPLILESATSATGDFFVGNSGNVAINGDVEITSTCNDNIQMSAGSGTVTFGTGNISIGTGGFSAGRLTFANFTQTGTATTNLTLTGSSILEVGPASTFNNNFTGIAPRLVLDGCTYNGTTYLEKTGATVDNSAGGNVFNGPTTIVNSSPNSIISGVSGLDVFNGDLTLRNTGSASIQLASQVAGTQFNGNITLTCTGGTGIFFGNNGGTSTLATGRTISIDPGGFSSGELGLRQFTQLGTTSQSLTLTGATLLRLGPSSQFNGNVTFVAPQILLNGTTYNGVTYIEKTGATDNAGSGGNAFNNTTTIVNSGSGYLLTANTTGDTYTDVTLTNSGSSILYVAHNGASTFNGNISVNSTFGGGVFFGNGTGTSTLADGRYISVGANGFTRGDLRLFRFTQLGSTAQTLMLTNIAVLRIGLFTTFNGPVTLSAPQLLLNNVTYNQTAVIEKTGAGDNTSNGGNVFNGNATLINSGSGYLMTANTSPDIYNSTLTITNRGSNFIYMAQGASGNQFNGDIYFNSTGTSRGIVFGNGTGLSTLAAGFSLLIGTDGFNNGELILRRFTQLGLTPQTLTLTSNARLRLGPSSEFNGAVDFKAPRLFVEGVAFKSSAILEKTGAADDSSTGGNSFAGNTSITNSGSGFLLFGQSGIGDVFNGTTTITNSGSNAIYVAQNTTGNSFSGNLIVNSINSSQGVFFGAGTNPGVTLVDGGSLSIGGLGFNIGTLLLRGFTQLGLANQSLTLTANSSLRVGSNSQFNGPVNFVAPRIFLDGCTYNNTAYIEKSGANNDDSAGNNIFNGVTTIVNSGSGYIRSAISASALDFFNNDLTLTNSGSSLIRMADVAAGTVFNGNVVVNSTGGQGIFFGEGGGTSSLANNRTISVGGLGWTFGTLSLRRFTQVGTTPQSIILPPLPLSTALLRVGPASAFNGNVTLRAPRVALDGASYNGTAIIEKTGANNDASVGGNTFASTTTITNSGTGDFVFGSSALDTFNGDLTLTNTGSASLRLSETVNGSVYNGNIVVNCTFGTGIFFGNNNGSSTLASGRTISIGASGFTSGTLALRFFTQLSATAQSLTLTGVSTLRVGPSSTFNGNVTFISPQVLLQGGTYNGTAYVEKNGATNNDSFGNNIFASTTNIVSSGSGNFRLSTDNSGSNNGDTFNGNVTFTRTGSGVLSPALNRTSNFAGNISIASTSILVFGSGNGVVQMTGGNAQSLNRLTGTAVHNVTRLTMAKSANTLTLNAPIDVNVVTFTSGIINTTTTNILNFVNAATTTGANDLSYVDGPVTKTGNQSFTFPVGNGGFYRPIAIGTPSTNTHQFRAQYFRSGQTFGTSMPASFYSLSTCEYWLLDRTIGASNVSVTLSWNEAICSNYQIGNPADLRVARWNNTTWVDQGNGGTTVAGTTGTIVSSGTVNSFSPFTLASVSSANPLPITLKKFWLDNLAHTVALNWITSTEQNNHYFTIEASSDGENYSSIGRVEGAGTSIQERSYTLIDEAPAPGLSYYRLTQVDFDGKQQSWLLSNFRKGEAAFFVYPNPAGEERVQLSQKGDIKIFNNLNQLVFQGSDVREFNAANLAPGVYYVRNQLGQVTRFIRK